MTADFTGRGGGRPPYQGGGARPQAPAPGVDAAKIRKAVLAGDAAGIDAGAEELAEALSRRGLSLSQIRNFYGSVAKIRDVADAAQQVDRIRMMRSRLAYLTARANADPKNRGCADDLWAVFGQLTREVQAAQVPAFCDFAEAVVAYHKYFDKSGQGDRRG